MIPLIKNVASNYNLLIIVQMELGYNFFLSQISGYSILKNTWKAKCLCGHSKKIAVIVKHLILFINILIIANPTIFSTKNEFESKRNNIRHRKYHRTKMCVLK